MGHPILQFGKTNRHTLLYMQVVSSMYIKVKGNVFPKLSPDWFCTNI